MRSLSKKERRFIREKEARKLILELSARVKGISQQLASPGSPIEVARADKGEIFFIEGAPAFARSDNMLFPTLASGRFLSSLPRVVVNMGAIPYVCKGADVMAPGIVSFEGAFEKEDLVVVSDERHNKPISISLALCSSQEAEKLGRGRVLKNIHYVGDSIWNEIKQFAQRE